MLNGFHVSKVAVLGAGVMGAQIAAHFANSGIRVILFDLKSSEKDVNFLINKSLNNLTKINPKPLAYAKSLEYISVANYDDNLEQLKSCDLIIEAIAERLDWKENLYTQILKYVSEKAIIASNTSGLSIASLAECMPVNLRKRFCGIHFFNPPRYMPLVELIPSKYTDSSILPTLETFLVTVLGKTVVIAKDTPNFIANRIGVFSMLVTCFYTEKFNIPLDVVDKLTGKNLGRAKSATFRTADVVGLDVFAHVVQTLSKNCKDGFENFYNLPSWINNLIEKGFLGQKTKQGFYKKDADGLKVLDINTQEYIISNNKADENVLAILKKKNWEAIFDELYTSELIQAKFLWSCFRDIFHYVAILLGEIADNPRDMDIAIRTGFAWKEGVFEIWQLGGFNKIANWIKNDIEKGLTVAKIPLPQWVFIHKDGVYLENKNFNIKTNLFETPKFLPIYDRQLFPLKVLNEKNNVNKQILYENSGVVLWHNGDNIGILSFKSKMCAIGMDVLLGLEAALDIASEMCVAMVIWQEQEIFSVGANLEEFGFAIMMNGVEAVDNIIDTGHRIVVNKLRYSKIPVVAAVRGFTFGGGCEIMLHCSSVVAALESYIGLVEAGVGLLPGWGGSTEMAYRASLSIDPWKDFEKRYKNLAMAGVATSAYEALEMGFLRENDTIVMNTHEVLFIAKEKAKYLVMSNYKPPIKPKFKVFGNQGIANVEGLLVNMHAGNQISDHDMLIAKNIAVVMSGGYIEKNSIVSEDWVLNIEKNMFRELAISEKTAARIQYMLENGKPLRN